MCSFDLFQVAFVFARQIVLVIAVFCFCKAHCVTNVFVKHGVSVCESGWRWCKGAQFNVHEHDSEFGVLP